MAAGKNYNAPHSYNISCFIRAKAVLIFGITNAKEEGGGAGREREREREKERERLLKDHIEAKTEIKLFQEFSKESPPFSTTQNKRFDSLVFRSRKQPESLGSGAV